jgi:hypothetical protein
MTPLGFRQEDMVAAIVGSIEIAAFQQGLSNRREETAPHLLEYLL